MEPPALEFVEDLYDEETLTELLREFREKAYVVLPDVFRRETVDAYVEQLEAVKHFNGLSYQIPEDLPHCMSAAPAPRARQIVPRALSHSEAQPHPAIYMTVWIIQTEDSAGDVPSWHKDREPDGMPGKEYHYPRDVFLLYYFEDMGEEHGPTRIIPGSHGDVSMTPHSGAPQESIHLRKQDGLLLDQRAWHSGSKRTAPGTRFVVCYGYYAAPIFYGTLFPMTGWQQREWVRAKGVRDQIFWGGPYPPPEELTEDTPED